MKAQRTSGRCPAAGVPAAALALAVLPAGPVPAAPASADEPVGASISALWQRLSGWARLGPGRERPRAATPATASLRARELDPEGTLRLDDEPAAYGRADGEEGYKLDPCG